MIRDSAIHGPQRFSTRRVCPKEDAGTGDREPLMSWSVAATPPLRGVAPATLEAMALFRVKTAAISEPAAPMKGDPNMVLLTGADGGVVVYPPSKKLVILAAARERLRPQPRV
jgi:hypothetical protein